MNRKLFARMFLLTLLVVFAVPGQMLCGTRGWLGVEVQELDKALKEALDYQGDGVLVKEVYEDSPAGKAGLSAGDIISRLGSEDVKSLKEFVDMVAESEPGSKVDVTVMRKGKKKTLKVEIGEREKSEDFSTFGKHFKGLKSLKCSSRAYLGVKLEDLTEELGEYFGSSEGALVMSVLDDSPAATAGFRAGDVIREIDGTRIHDASDVIEVLEHKEGGEEVEVMVVRKNREQTLKVTLEEHSGKDFFGSFPGTGGHKFLFNKPGGSFHGVPDLGDIDIYLDDLGDYLDSEDFEKDLQGKIHVIEGMSKEKIEALEKKIDQLGEKLKDLEKKLSKN